MTKNFPRKKWLAFLDSCVPHRDIVECPDCMKAYYEQEGHNCQTGYD